MKTPNIGIVPNASNVKVDPYHGRYVDEQVAITGIPGFMTVRVYLDGLTSTQSGIGTGPGKGTIYEKRFEGRPRDAVAALLDPAPDRGPANPVVEPRVPRYEGPQTAEPIVETDLQTLAIHPDPTTHNVEDESGNGNYVEALVDAGSGVVRLRIFIDQLDFVRTLQEEIERLATVETKHKRTMDDLEVMRAAQERIHNRTVLHRLSIS